MAAGIAHVREMTYDDSNKPIPGTLLATEVQQRGLTSATCWDYVAVLSQILEPYKLRTRERVTSFNGVETHEVLEFYDDRLAKWIVADPTFGILYADSSYSQGESLDDLTVGVNEFAFNSIAYTLVSRFGDDLLSDYYMDPWMYFLNPSEINSQTTDVVNDPRKFLVPRNIADIAGRPGTYFFEFRGEQRNATILDATAGRVVVSSASNSPWAAAQIFLTGWSPEELPDGVRIYTLPIYWSNAAAVQVPQEGEQHIDASIPVVFEWPQVAGAEGYQLIIGSSDGASDVYVGKVLQDSLTQVPLQQETSYFAQLDTLKDGQWFTHITTFKTGWGIARIQSPQDRQSNVDASHPVEVVWSSVKNAHAYYVWVGSTLGASDVYDSGSLPTTALSLSLSLQAGQTYYLRMFTLKGVGWEYGDSRFSTAPNE